ncbi:MAG: hypothetical protein H0X65_11790 [Gemmatimonadetes bacterium]|nr:hypothetical protein [Gemmatimonadota bacterium]
MTETGLKVNAATSAATVYEALAAQADIRRASVSGVSVDEELVQLIRHQQAYAAATRLVSAADEMAKAIINLV